MLALLLFTTASWAGACDYDCDGRCGTLNDGLVFDGDTCVCQAPEESSSPSSPQPPCGCQNVSETGGCLDAPAGMPVWSVSEPFVNVWLKDTPLHYKASRGRMVRFALSYKNRNGIQGDVGSAEPRIFSFGSRWHSLWRSYLEAIPTESTNFWAYVGSGAARKYTLNQVHYATLGKLVQISSTNVLQSPNGNILTFGLTTTVGGVTRHFLTRKEDAYGNATIFQYLITNNTIRLDKVLDVDNRAITFEYAQVGNYSNVITKVVGPRGLTNVLQYDSSGRLTNITDTAGLRSQMQYDSANLTALITPYGATTFSYFSISNEMEAVKVTELGVKNNFFVYKAKVDGGKVPANYTSYVPSTTNASQFEIGECPGHS
jgi:YD repeat-containing protein